MKKKQLQLTFTHCLMSFDSNTLTTQYSLDAHIEPDTKVGSCVYTITEPYPEPTITFIQTFESYRRRGIATAMVMELERKYGGICWDYKFTDDGRKWFNTLIERKIVKNSCFV
jgi:hypothetical protein